MQIQWSSRGAMHTWTSNSRPLTRRCQLLTNVTERDLRCSALCQQCPESAGCRRAAAGAQGPRGVPGPADPGGVRGAGGRAARGWLQRARGGGPRVPAAGGRRRAAPQPRPHAARRAARDLCRVGAAAGRARAAAGGALTPPRRDLGQPLLMLPRLENCTAPTNACCLSSSAGLA